MFVKNGSFDFTYDNGRGVIGSSRAEVHWIQEEPFIMTRKTTKASESITIPLYGRLSYDFRIDWGDGTTEKYQSNSLSLISHRYTMPGDYQVKIYGIFPSIRFSATSQTNNDKLRSIDQWGGIEWKYLDYAFFGTTNLQILATDTPNLNNVSSTSYMFYGATHLSGDFSRWDTSNIQDMSFMFSDAINFDQDLSYRNIESINSPFSLQYMLHNTALSTYNYNAILDSRSKQNIPSNIYEFSVDATYGGECSGVSNAAAGIAGRARLITTSSWNITDNGLEQCANSYGNRPFIMTRRATPTIGNIMIPLVDGFYYDFEIHRGDGTVRKYQGSSLSAIGHRYTTPGDYQIKIYGTFPSIRFSSSISTNRNQIRSIDQWGDIEWQYLDSAFYGATNLQILATDAPNLSKVSTTAYMFYGAKHLDADFSARDISTIAIMDNMLYNTALSTYHYNALLWSRSNQNVFQNIYFNAVPAQYGGCASNRQQGISGYDTLRRDKGRNITDEGLAVCIAKGTITYNTT
jgi:surface protein